MPKNIYNQPIKNKNKNIAKKGYKLFMRNMNIIKDIHIFRENLTAVNDQ